VNVKRVKKMHRGRRERGKADVERKEQRKNTFKLNSHFCGNV
jgi:hypothetical protein